MLNHPTLDLMHSLGLDGMAKGFKDLQNDPESQALDHQEWLGLLLNYEATSRQQKRFERRLRTAKLRQSACLEDVDYRAARGLDRSLFQKLATNDWIRDRRNLLIIGPCGIGKSYLACALGHKACRDDFSVAYHRAPRLFAALALARGDGRYARVLRSIAKIKLLIIDDWGPDPLNAEQRRRHPRSHRPQCPSHRTDRRKPQKEPKPKRQHLTPYTRVTMINTDLRRRRPTGRHQIGTVAGFGSEPWSPSRSEKLAGFIGIRKMHSLATCRSQKRRGLCR